MKEAFSEGIIQLQLPVPTGVIFPRGAFFPPLPRQYDHRKKALETLGNARVYFKTISKQLLLTLSPLEWKGHRDTCIPQALTWDSGHSTFRAGVEGLGACSQEMLLISKC